MTELATRRPSREQGWPMTGEAWCTLVDELLRLRADVADSPLGSAVLGCVPGDRVEVTAPAGRRVVTVLSVG